MLIVILVLSYIIGSIPMGYVIVKAISGQDVRQVGSGRTGGTNAMRAAGLAAGLLTALLDVLKGGAGVWVAQALLAPDQRPLGMALAGLAAILGHNYSVFLRFKGGAGGAPAVGAAFAIWPLSVLIVLPIGVGILFGVGYASVATLSVAVVITALFGYRIYFMQWPPEYILYGLGSILLLAWALRPNIRRLLRGEERLIGWRAKRLKQAGAESTKGQ
jgi:acyl phosphate:glycerol-3-phosphate acyltransferase